MTSTELATARRPLRSGLAAMPALLLALLPKVACPACWPAYGSALSALGLGGLLASPWRVPLLAVFLAPALWLLARSCRRCRSRWPFVLGVSGAAASMVGACGDSLALSLAGSVAFVVAILVAAGRGTSTPVRQPGDAAPPAPCCRRA